MTDDERRRVAERLRAYGKEFGDPTWRDLCNVVFWDDDSYPTAVRKLHLIDRLADLIEPSCDRDALMALEDEMFEDATGLALISQLEKNEELQDLQSTMAKALMDYARRIREACGEAVE